MPLNSSHSVNSMSVDPQHDGIVMLSPDVVFFNIAQTRPDGTKIYHIFEHTIDEIEHQESFDLFNEFGGLISKASKQNIHVIKQILAKDGISLEAWLSTPPSMINFPSSRSQTETQLTTSDIDSKSNYFLPKSQTETLQMGSNLKSKKNYSPKSQQEILQMGASDSDRNYSLSRSITETHKLSSSRDLNFNRNSTQSENVFLQEPTKRQSSLHSVTQPPRQSIQQLPIQTPKPHSPSSSLDASKMHHQYSSTSQSIHQSQSTSCSTSLGKFNPFSSTVSNTITDNSFSPQSKQAHPNLHSISKSFEMSTKECKSVSSMSPLSSLITSPSKHHSSFSPKKAHLIVSQLNAVSPNLKPPVLDSHEILCALMKQKSNIDQIPLEDDLIQIFNRHSSSNDSSYEPDLKQKTSKCNVRAKDISLKDYPQEGLEINQNSQSNLDAYFVTSCVQEKECLNKVCGDNEGVSNECVPIIVSPLSSTEAGDLSPKSLKISEDGIENSIKLQDAVIKKEEEKLDDVLNEVATSLINLCNLNTLHNLKNSTEKSSRYHPTVDEIKKETDIETDGKQCVSSIKVDAIVPEIENGINISKKPSKEKSPQGSQFYEDTTVSERKGLFILEGNSTMVNTDILKQCDFNKKRKCLNCKFGSNHKKNLARHSSQCHRAKDDNLGKSFSCSKCNYVARTKALLNCHMLKSHKVIGKLQCHECDYFTDYTSYMKSHLLTHSPFRPFKCSMCQFSSTLKGNLRRHEAAHEKRRQKGGLHEDRYLSKLMKCSWCDFKTIRLAMLIKHERNHSNGKALEKIGSNLQLQEKNYSNVQFEYNLKLKSPVSIKEDSEDNVLKATTPLGIEEATDTYSNECQQTQIQLEPLPSLNLDLPLHKTLNIQKCTDILNIKDGSSNGLSEIHLPGGSVGSLQVSENLSPQKSCILVAHDNNPSPQRHGFIQQRQLLTNEPQTQMVNSSMFETQKNVNFDTQPSDPILNECNFNSSARPPLEYLADVSHIESLTSVGLGKSDHLNEPKEILVEVPGYCCLKCKYNAKSQELLDSHLCSFLEKEAVEEEFNLQTNSNSDTDKVRDGLISNQGNSKNGTGNIVSQEKLWTEDKLRFSSQNVMNSNDPLELKTIGTFDYRHLNKTHPQINIKPVKSTKNLVPFQNSNTSPTSNKLSLQSQTNILPFHFEKESKFVMKEKENGLNEPIVTTNYHTTQSANDKSNINHFITSLEVSKSPMKNALLDKNHDMLNTCQGPNQSTSWDQFKCSNCFFVGTSLAALNQHTLSHVEFQEGVTNSPLPSTHRLPLLDKTTLNKNNMETKFRVVDTVGLFGASISEKRSGTQYQMGTEEMTKQKQSLISNDDETHAENPESPRGNVVLPFTNEGHLHSQASANFDLHCKDKFSIMKKANTDISSAPTPPDRKTLNCSSGYKKASPIVKDSSLRSMTIPCEPSDTSPSRILHQVRIVEEMLNLSNIFPQNPKECQPVKNSSTSESYDSDSTSFNTRFKKSNLEIDNFKPKSPIGQSASHLECVNDAFILKCSRCCYTAKQKSTLRKHEMLAHSNIKCNECNYVTHAMRNFRRHRKIHHNTLHDLTQMSAPCDKKASHLQILHCEICDFIAHSNTSLKMHQLSHLQACSAELYSSIAKGKIYSEKHNSTKITEGGNKISEKNSANPQVSELNLTTLLGQQRPAISNFKTDDQTTTSPKSTTSIEQTTCIRSIIAEEESKQYISSEFTPALNQKCKKIFDPSLEPPQNPLNTSHLFHDDKIQNKSLFEEDCVLNASQKNASPNKRRPTSNYADKPDFQHSESEDKSNLTSNFQDVKRSKSIHCLEDATETHLMSTTTDTKHPHIENENKANFRNSKAIKGIEFTNPISAQESSSICFDDIDSLGSIKKNMEETTESILYSLLMQKQTKTESIEEKGNVKLLLSLIRGNSNANDLKEDITDDDSSQSLKNPVFQDRETLKNIQMSLSIGSDLKEDMMDHDSSLILKNPVSQDRETLKDIQMCLLTISDLKENITDHDSSPSQKNPVSQDGETPKDIQMSLLTKSDLKEDMTDHDSSLILKNPVSRDIETLKDIQMSLPTDSDLKEDMTDHDSSLRLKNPVSQDIETLKDIQISLLTKSGLKEDLTGHDSSPRLKNPVSQDRETLKDIQMSLSTDSDLKEDRTDHDSSPSQKNPLSQDRETPKDIQMSLLTESDLKEDMTDHDSSPILKNPVSRDRETLKDIQMSLPTDSDLKEDITDHDSSLILKNPVSQDRETLKNIQMSLPTDSDLKEDITDHDSSLILKNPVSQDRETQADIQMSLPTDSDLKEDMIDHDSSLRLKNPVSQDRETPKDIQMSLLTESDLKEDMMDHDSSLMLKNCVSQDRETPKDIQMSLSSDIDLKEDMTDHESSPSQKNPVSQDRETPINIQMSLLTKSDLKADMTDHDSSLILKYPVSQDRETPKDVQLSLPTDSDLKENMTDHDSSPRLKKPVSQDRETPKDIQMSLLTNNDLKEDMIDHDSSLSIKNPVSQNRETPKDIQTSLSTDSDLKDMTDHDSSPRLKNPVSQDRETLKDIQMSLLTESDLKEDMIDHDSSPILKNLVSQDRETLKDIQMSLSSNIDLKENMTDYNSSLSLKNTILQDRETLKDIQMSLSTDSNLEEDMTNHDSSPSLKNPVSQVRETPKDLQMSLSTDCDSKEDMNNHDSFGLKNPLSQDRETPKDIQMSLFTESDLKEDINEHDSFLNLKNPVSQDRATHTLNPNDIQILPSIDPNLKSDMKAHYSSLSFDNPLLQDVETLTSTSNPIQLAQGLFSSSECGTKLCHAMLQERIPSSLHSPQKSINIKNSITNVAGSRIVKSAIPLYESSLSSNLLNSKSTYSVFKNCSKDNETRENEHSASSLVPDTSGIEKVSSGSPMPTRAKSRLSCCHCPYFANSNVELTEHKLTHCKTKFVKCRFCSYTTNLNKKLKVHESKCKNKSKGLKEKSIFESQVSSRSNCSNKPVLLSRLEGTIVSDNLGGTAQIDQLQNKSWRLRSSTQKQKSRNISTSPSMNVVNLMCSSPAKRMKCEQPEKLSVDVEIIKKTSQKFHLVSNDNSPQKRNSTRASQTKTILSICKKQKPKLKSNLTSQSKKSPAKATLKSKLKKPDKKNSNNSSKSVNKQFYCSLCKYSSVRKDLLKRHEIIHRKVKLKCTRCSYSTNTKSKLKRHEITHNKIKVTKLNKTA